MMDRVCICTQTTWRSAWRASIRCPHGLAVAIDGDTVGATPRSSLYVRPVPDHPIGIGTTVDRLNFIGLRSASARLRLEAASLRRSQNEDDRHSHPESPAT